MVSIDQPHYADNNSQITQKYFAYFEEKSNGKHNKKIRLLVNQIDTKSKYVNF